MNTISLPTANIQDINHENAHSNHNKNTNKSNNNIAMPALEGEKYFDEDEWNTDDNEDRFNDNDVTPPPPLLEFDNNIINDKSEENSNAIDDD